MVIPSLFPAASVSKTDPGKGPEHLPFEGEGEDHVLLQENRPPPGTEGAEAAQKKAGAEVLS